jgi:hypothetical protein
MEHLRKFYALDYFSAGPYENASIGNLVNQTLKSVVREICTLRSVGVGVVRTAPSTRRWEL